MTQPNGHDVPTADTESAAIDEIKAMAGQIQTTVLERVRDYGAPFEQKAHTLMLEGVDKLTQHWAGAMGHVRENTQTIEQMVIAQAAKVKEEITKLHLLGVMAMKEAERGREVARHLAEELDAMKDHVEAA